MLGDVVNVAPRLKHEAAAYGLRSADEPLHRPRAGSGAVSPLVGRDRELCAVPPAELPAP